MQALTVDLNHVRYVAPIVTSVTTDSIYIWIGSRGGKSVEYLINVTVNPSGGSLPGGYDTPTPGQFTSSYNFAASNFTVNYTLGSTVTKAWILASTNGSTYNIVSTIDPVTVSNRSGSRTVSVAGSGAVSQVYFRLRTQIGAAAVEEGATINVGYTPAPAAPKTTEIPLAPTLYINGWQTGNTQVPMFWPRVNDSLYQDNVVHYDVEYANNPNFTGSTLVNVGNTAAGLNLYESVSYTATGLLDNNTYYFRVRGVNYAGTGPWSNVGTMLINVQDGPVFASTNPVFPPNGATGITKLPALEVNVSDPEGDPLYTAFEISESPTMASGIRYFGHGGQQAYLNVSRLDPSEWGTSILKPNTHYYWRAIVQEEGRFLDYYGGSWPTSPIYNFTTENVGGNYTLSVQSLVSGTIRANERLVYRLQVTNNGNERSEANNVSAFLVQNGVDKPFFFAGFGYVAPLDPGQSTTTDVTVYFRDSLVTGNDGIVYDNILKTGTNLVRFKSNQYAIATPQASVDYPINYANQGGPVITWSVRGSASNKGTTPGGYFTVAESVTDDVRTERMKFDYRMSPSSPWMLLDDYTGGARPTALMSEMTHTGPTVVDSQNSFRWNIPANFQLTSTLQFRITAYDDTGATQEAISDAWSVFNGTFSVTAGATEFSQYRVGDMVNIPVFLNKAPGFTVLEFSVIYSNGINTYTLLRAELSGGGLNLTNGWNTSPIFTTNSPWLGSDGVVIPPIATVSLPSQIEAASIAGFFTVYVRGEITGLYGAQVSDQTDGLVIVSPPDLPAPFHQAIPMFALHDPIWPVGAWGRTNNYTPVALDWEGDTVVHAIMRQNYNYYEAQNGNDPLITREFRRYYYGRYDRSTGGLTEILLPDHDYEDIKVVGATVYAIVRDGTQISFSTLSAGGISAPQALFTLPASPENSDLPEFARLGAELFVASTTADYSNGGESSGWRNRLMRAVPSVLPYMEQPGFYRRHVDYGAYLNTSGGIYTLNASKIVISPLASWENQGYVWFESSNANVVGARYYGNAPGGAAVDLYTPTNTFTRWTTGVFSPRIRVFSDSAILIGQGTNNQVVIRRNLTDGSDLRVSFADGSFAETGKRSAISAGKWVALSSQRLLFVGNMSGDITAPAVSITTTDASFVSGQSKALAWTMSDNLNQLASVKVLKIVGGVTTVIGNYTSGTLPTSLSYTFADTVPSLILRVEAYDQSGNRGVAEKVLTRSSTFALASFTAASYSVPVATAASLSWTATPVDAFRVYNILTRPQGTTAWNTAGSVTGATFLLDTTLLSGTQEVRLESGGVTRDLPQPITITGNRFAFDNAGFAPASGTTGFVAASAPWQVLTWASNQPVSLAVAYTLLGRWDGAGSYVVLGGTGEKSLAVNVGIHTSVEWKVVAQWDGQEFVSSVRSLTLGTVAGGPTPVATAGGQTTVSPWVDLSWAAVPGATGMVVYRKDTRTDAVEELTRVAAGATSYRDAAVAYGDTFSYTLATVLGDVVSLQGAAASATLAPLLPLGITFVNANYQITAGNSNTVQWNAVLPAGVTAVYQDYQVYLRRGDGSIVASQSVTPAAGATAQVAYTGLEYNQSYVVDVFALNPNGSRLGTVPVQLHFSTGFDVRVVGAPLVAAPSKDSYGVNLTWAAGANADYYDIFRSTNGGALAWVGRSFAVGFADGSAPIGASVRYVVRSRNDNGYADSAQTAALTVGTGFQLYAQGAGLSGNNALAEADADNDGVGNLLEYAFGTLANSAASKYRPTVAPASAGGVEFTFTRLSARTDVVYDVEYSPDMQSWTTGASSSSGGVTTSLGGAVQAVTETGSGTVSVKIRLAAEVGGKVIFVRLRVSAL